MRSLAAVAVLLSACTTDAPPAAPPLVSSRPEPAGANCAYGGTALVAGIDDNGNGMLDDDEVTSMAYACSVGPRQLATTASEPPGPHCAHGGVAIELGLDTDGDGELSATEVQSTTYVCATDTTQPLIRIDDAGAQCSGGGSAIHVGIDLDHDGVLDDEEITSTTYECGTAPTATTIIGDVTVHNTAEIAALEGVDHIVGSLSCVETTPHLVDAMFSTIRLVDETVDCHVLGTIAFPELEHATMIQLSADTIDLPNLTGSISNTMVNLSTTAFLTANSIQIPRLAMAGLSVTTDSLSAPALVMGWIEASVNSLDVPVLQSGSITMMGGQSLHAPVFAAGSISIEYATMSALDLPALEESQYFTLYRDAQLASLTAPMLDSADDFYAKENPLLATCVLQRLAQQANAPSPVIIGNDDTATCP